MIPNILAMQMGRLEKLHLTCIGSKGVDNEIDVVNILSTCLVIVNIS